MPRGARAPKSGPLMAIMIGHNDGIEHVACLAGAKQRSSGKRREHQVVPRGASWVALSGPPYVALSGQKAPHRAGWPRARCGTIRDEFRSR